MMNEVYQMAQKLCADLERNYNECSPNSHNPRKFVIEAGRKYLKIVMCDTNGTGRSVHAFVDKVNGDLYKAASWQAPAKGVRFNLLTSYPTLSGADWAGGYLYIR
jgi:hypothetical protein